MTRAAFITIAILLAGIPGAFGQEPDTLETSGERVYRNGLRYDVIRGKYVTGEKFFVSYEDKRTKLNTWKEYYKNGHLKEEGVMTNGNHIYVGVWKYYAENGTLDSAVNYDNQYKISYFKAIEIAKQNGYRMPGMNVTITFDKHKKYWQIVRWTENKNRNGQTGEGILIDTESGSVTKPGYKLRSVY